MAVHPPGDGPPPPPRHAAPTGHAGQGDSVGPHTHTPAPTARGWRTPTARPVGGQLGERQRLTSDAPHNGGRHAPWGRPSATPTASNAGPPGCTLWGWCWVPTPAKPHPGHTGRGTLAARSRGRAAGGGTAPDTRCPSQRWQASPPRGRPPTTPAACSPNRACRPRGRCWAPTPTHPRPQHVGGGPQQPAQWAGSRGRDGAWPQTPLTMVEGTPPGDALPPPAQRATPARKDASCGAGAESPRSHRPHPGHTGRGTLAVAPEDRRPGEGQRLTPGAPHNGGRPPPPGTAPHHPRGTQLPQGMQAAGTVLGSHTHTPAPTARGWPIPTARPVGGQSGEGRRPDSDAPHNGGRHPPRGRPSATPTASNASPQGRTLWGWCRVPTPAPTAPGIHGLQNPGCLLQRTGGSGRDSA